MKNPGQSTPHLPGAIWRSSSYSGGNNECVEVARLRDAVPVRDSKRPAGPVIGFSPAAWRGFLDSLR
ncbi:DUF397 domain-containing protein [Streptomyces zingiberis]|uniref:DUF397 domain-containing protein n=1 Tax=Streptomyces zingiberis TaxID=2053010 RepID=A0ABX1BT17_9ACTN|nr:DUF397 domain-containing protein [Streptomyces zingiberis]NJQ00855.1 DUF397 domain-containing protein [Streptomyces zingiberis]